MPPIQIDFHPVILPGGKHHVSELQIVQPGEIVRREMGYTEKLNQAGEVVFRQTEGFAALLKAKLTAELALASVTPPKQDDPVNWVADTYWKNETGSPVQRFSTKWQVPAPPVVRGNQIIYLFNGMDPLDSSLGILQPVLQWGVSPSGGGAFWSVATYYVAKNNAAYSTEAVRVNPGDLLEGVITLLDQDEFGFNYRAEFLGVPATVLRVSSVAELVWCYETLETYRANVSNAYYPASPSTAFSAITIQTATGNPAIEWNKQTGGSNNGQYAEIISNSLTGGEVDIYYR